MGLLTFSINVTLDGCVDHRAGIGDDETHAFFTRLMDEGQAMLWGRVTYEMMESYWPAVARGDEEAPPVRLRSASPSYVETDFACQFVRFWFVGREAADLDEARRRRAKSGWVSGTEFATI
jgi:hypothetical protein